MSHRCSNLHPGDPGYVWEEEVFSNEDFPVWCVELDLLTHEDWSMLNDDFTDSLYKLLEAS